MDSTKCCSYVIQHEWGKRDEHESIRICNGIIFAVVATLHLIRVIAGWEFRAGGWEAPSWVSLVALATAGYLSYQSLRIADRSEESG